MLPDVLSVRVLDRTRLWMEFDDGVAGTFDLSPLIAQGGVFEALRDADYFARVTVDREAGTICWPNGADVCPDVLYSAIAGVPLPGQGASEEGWIVAEGEGTP
jgi:hypothetical protein